jgi:hypothetical protein
MLISIFLFLGFFFINNDINAALICHTSTDLVSQIHFNPGVINFDQPIQVTGETQFSTCIIDSTNQGTGELVFYNNPPISFSCFNIFMYNLTAYVSFSFDNNQKHYVTLVPSDNLLGILPPNIASMLSNL